MCNLAFRVITCQTLCWLLRSSAGKVCHSLCVCGAGLVGNKTQDGIYGRGRDEDRRVEAVCFWSQIFKPAGIWLHPSVMIGLSRCLLGQLSWAYLRVSLCKHIHAQIHLHPHLIQHTPETKSRTFWPWRPSFVITCHALSNKGWLFIAGSKELCLYIYILYMYIHSSLHYRYTLKKNNFW